MKNLIKVMLIAVLGVSLLTIAQAEEMKKPPTQKKEFLVDKVVNFFKGEKAKGSPPEPKALTKEGASEKIVETKGEKGKSGEDWGFTNDDFDSQFNYYKTFNASEDYSSLNQSENVDLYSSNLSVTAVDVSLAQQPGLPNLEITRIYSSVPDIYFFNAGYDPPYSKPGYPGNPYPVSDDSRELRYNDMPNEMDFAKYRNRGLMGIGWKFSFGYFDACMPDGNSPGGRLYRPLRPEQSTSGYTAEGWKQEYQDDPENPGKDRYVITTKIGTKYYFRYLQGHLFNGSIRENGCYLTKIENVDGNCITINYEESPNNTINWTENIEGEKEGGGTFKFLMQQF